MDILSGVVSVSDAEIAEVGEVIPPCATSAHSSSEVVKAFREKYGLIKTSKLAIVKVLSLYREQLLAGKIKLEIHQPFYFLCFFFI